MKMKQFSESHLEKITEQLTTGWESSESHRRRSDIHKQEVFFLFLFHITANSTEFFFLFVYNSAAVTHQFRVTHPQWLGPQSLLQYSLSHSGFWPCTGLGAPGDWEPPTLFWYSAWIWENPCRAMREEQEVERLSNG